MYSTNFRCVLNVQLEIIELITNPFFTIPAIGWAEFLYAKLCKFANEFRINYTN